MVTTATIQIYIVITGVHTSRTSKQINMFHRSSFVCNVFTAVIDNVQSMIGRMSKVQLVIQGARNLVVLLDIQLGATQ